MRRAATLLLAAAGHRHGLPLVLAELFYSLDRLFERDGFTVTPDEALLVSLLDMPSTMVFPKSSVTVMNASAPRVEVSSWAVYQMRKRGMSAPSCTG